MANGYNVAVAGATGAVGVEMIKTLEKRNFPVKNLKLLASARSAGKTLKFKGEDVTVEEMTEASFRGVDIALFSAGGDSRDPDAVLRAILDEAQRLAREGIDPDFFEQIRRASFGATLRALNSFENIAISMADGYFRGFDALRFPEAYASIEKADVERFLRENLTDSRRAISIIEPKKEG